MNRPDLITLMKDRAPSAKFYVQSPFRTRSFLFATALCLVVLSNCTIVIDRSLQKQNLMSVIIIATAMLALGGVWIVGFETHKSIRRLFDDGQIEKLERGSALDKVLSATSKAVTLGLFFAFMAFECCLFAVAVLYPRMP